MTTLRESRVRARKKYWCFACGGDIEPSELYVNTVGVWDGDFNAIREHVFCREYIQNLYSSGVWAWGDSYGGGDALESWRNESGGLDGCLAARDRHRAKHCLDASTDTERADAPPA